MPIQVEVISEGGNSEVIVAVITATSVLVTSIFTQIVTYLLQTRKERVQQKRRSYLELLVILKKIEQGKFFVELGDSNYYSIIRNAKYLPSEYQNKLLCIIYKFANPNSNDEFKGYKVSEFDVKHEVDLLVDYLYKKI